MGTRWGLLMCFHQTLCNAKIDVPRSVDNKIQVARCIIETGCRETLEVERLLDDVENTLVRKASLGRIEDFDSWARLLDKTKKYLLDRRETMEIPFMTELVQSYEFLSYCISE